MKYLLLTLSLVFVEGCGCFFPCFYPGKGFGYGYMGYTPGMVCIAKPNGTIECISQERQKSLQVPEEKQEKEGNGSYAF